MNINHLQVLKTIKPNFSKVRLVFKKHQFSNISSK